jgi:hypothetical protein
MGAAIAGRGGVGVRVYLDGDALVKAGFSDIAASGKRMWAEISQGERSANPALRTLSRGVGEAKSAVGDLASEAGAAGRVLGGFGPIGVGVAAALGAATLAFGKLREGMKFADELQQQAQAANTTTTKLQEYQFMLEKTDGKASDAAGSIKDFTEKLDQAANGLNPKALKAFEKLGYTAEDLQRLKETPDAIDQVIARLAGLSNSNDQLGVSAKIGLGAMIGLIQQSGGHLEELKRQAHDLGYVMEGEVLEKLAEANKQFEATAHIIDVQFKQAFVDLAPVLLSTMHLLAQLAQQVTDFFEQFRQAEDRSTAALQRERGKLLQQSVSAFAQGPNAIMGNRFQGATEARLKEIDDELAARRLSGSIANAFGQHGGGGSGTLTNMGGGKGKADPNGVLPNNLALRPYDIAPGFERTFDPNSAAYFRDVKNDQRDLSLTAQPAIGEFKKSFGPLADDLRDVNEQTERFGDVLQEDLAEGFHDLARGLADAVVQGRNLGEVAGQVFKKVLADLLEHSFSAFGSRVLGGVLGSVLHIPMHAAGTLSAPGGLSLVGEEGPELVSLPPGSRVYSAGDTARMGGGATVNLGGIHIDARGAGPREVDQLRAEMANLQRELPVRVAHHVNEAVDRGIVR